MGTPCSSQLCATTVNNMSLFRYIATQGTLSTTAKDFWQMVWETKAIVIFMVTKEVGKNL